ncbi:Pentatricopeptide repeat-containing protein [Thalictrum thalictroides]|uniref:Pentatricopeptide repeat-containing protein n=1 Tax=Thalictrum thalictroides TaxID=46969 RepID=A0A7J6W950_THATH|nr:Pentatricopeptide repeat-containing protein [Thalictrum thalictroides]
MIKGYSLSGPSQEPLQLFYLMKSRGIWPDQFTFAPLLKSCTNISDLNFGRQVHADVLTVGFVSHSSIQIGLVELYTGCDTMDDAKRMFDEMPHRDVVVWNIIIRGFCKRGNVEMGFHLFQQMSERTNVSWNTMIAGLAKSGREKEALELFREMLDEQFEPDDATLVTVLPVCGHLGAVELGSWIRSYADSRGLLRKFVQVANSVLDFYYKCGDLEMASRVFDEMPKKSVVSWNTMISGLAYNGQGELGVKMFEDMRRQGVDPNDATFVGTLSCCTHAGLTQKGKELFDLMITKHKIKPRLQHYGCMVDLLGRGGCIREAQELINKMPMRPNAAIWGALLSACRIHGEAELAECAVKELIRLEPQNSGNYVLLSNIYAELGKWHDVEKARALMKEKCVLKVPGESAIR